MGASKSLGQSIKKFDYKKFGRRFRRYIFGIRINIFGFPLDPEFTLVKNRPTFLFEIAATSAEIPDFFEVLTALKKLRDKGNYEKSSLLP